MNDAGSGVLLVEEEKAKELGLPILARVIGTATTGVDPDVMGIGPISATQKALAKCNLTVDDIGTGKSMKLSLLRCLLARRPWAFRMIN